MILPTALVAMLLLGLAPAWAAKSPVNMDSDGIALQGYDAVAYHSQGMPVKGRAEFDTEWNGARWRFASAGNRDAFARSPEKYAPQYGGYCAFAVSQGYTAGIDPAAWSVVNGRLYLNFSRRVQERWSKDIPGHIERGDRNWPGVLQS
jgi:YHS domain-containing protein